MAQSLCAASCCTSCPSDPSAFATMGFWPRRARGSSCQQHAWLCRCLQPARRPLSRPRRSWRGWPGWMWACARVARWAGCAPSLCWPGLGACLDRPAPWRLTAGGRHEPLPWPGSVNPSHGRWQAFGAVLRVGAPTRAQHELIHGPGVVWRVQLTTCAVTLARSIDATNQSAHNLLWHTGCEACKPLCRTRPPFAVAVQSNKVYPPQEVLLVSTDLASRQINAIR